MASLASANPRALAQIAINLCCEPGICIAPDRVCPATANTALTAESTTGQGSIRRDESYARGTHVVLELGFPRDLGGTLRPYKHSAIQDVAYGFP